MMRSGSSKEFLMQVGGQQGTVLSPLIFANEICKQRLDEQTVCRLLGFNDKSKKNLIEKSLNWKKCLRARC